MVEGDEQPLCDLRDRIVDTSVDAAEEVGWKNLRLRKVAQRLGVPLTAVLEYFRILMRWPMPGSSER
jgi:DNA-binding transcriptional regulator YbjK